MARLPEPDDLLRGMSRAEQGRRLTGGQMREMSHQVYRDYDVPAEDVVGAMDLTGGAPLTGFMAPPVMSGSYEAVSMWEEVPDRLADEGFYWEQGYGYQNLAAFPMDPQAPADITLAPTSTINPDRPRTVAAGWDRTRKVLTTVFRDGTFYNYYDVSGLEWANFARARSKGRFIKAYLDGHRRGYASMGSVPLEHRELLYRVGRVSQYVQQGVQSNQSRTSRRTGANYGKAPRRKVS